MFNCFSHTFIQDIPGNHKPDTFSSKLAFILALTATREIFRLHVVVFGDILEILQQPAKLSENWALVKLNVISTNRCICPLSWELQAGSVPSQMIGSDDIRSVNHTFHSGAAAILWAVMLCKTNKSPSTASRHTHHKHDVTWTKFCYAHNLLRL